MQGRVLSLINSLCTMMMPISLLIAAPVAELVGLQVWYWAGGLLVMLVALWAFLVPAINSLDRTVPSIQATAAAAEAPLV